MEKTDIKGFLTGLKNKKIYYWSNTGNAGDALIAHATYLLFDSLALDYQVIHDTSALQNEIVIFAGGGNLVEGRYTHMYKELMTCLLKNNQCIVLPHTIFGFKDLINHTQDNLVLFCREKVSYQMCLLNHANPEHLYLADDMAFNMPNTYFKEFKQPGIGRAICLRQDGESANLVPIPTDNIDISKSWNGPLWHNKQLAKHAVLSLASYLAAFEEVATDRLHVAILGCLLGKKVILYPNNYYKNRAMYENSLAGTHFQISFVNTSTDLLHSDYVNNMLTEHGFI